ncbi:hypothetical protein IJJ12_02755 [bacterium]|nr:hypothetical protein [bacterium]
MSETLSMENQVNLPAAASETIQPVDQTSRARDFVRTNTNYSPETVSRLYAFVHREKIADVVDPSVAPDAENSSLARGYMDKFQTQVEDKLGSESITPENPTTEITPAQAFKKGWEIARAFRRTGQVPAELTPATLDTIRQTVTDEDLSEALSEIALVMSPPPPELTVREVIDRDNPVPGVVTETTVGVTVDNLAQTPNPGVTPGLEQNPGATPGFSETTAPEAAGEADRLQAELDRLNAEFAALAQQRTDLGETILARDYRLRELSSRSLDSSADDRLHQLYQAAKEYRAAFQAASLAVQSEPDSDQSERLAQAVAAYDKMVTYGLAYQREPINDSQVFDLDTDFKRRLLHLARGTGRPEELTATKDQLIASLQPHGLTEAGRAGLQRLVDRATELSHDTGARIAQALASGNLRDMYDEEAISQLNVDFAHLEDELLRRSDPLAELIHAHTDHLHTIDQEIGAMSQYISLTRQLEDVRRQRRHLREQLTSLEPAT